MPGRPPKKWMRSCIRKVEKKGQVTDAGAVCGANWYHKMSSKAKRRVLRRE